MRAKFDCDETRIELFKRKYYQQCSLPNTLQCVSVVFLNSMYPNEANVVLGIVKFQLEVKLTEDKVRSKIIDF